MSLFKIRREVMLALEAYVRASFHERMVSRMLENHEETASALGDERLRDEVERGIHKAINYGIMNEADIESFLDMLFVRGFDFDVHEEHARRILNNKKMTGASKIGFLTQLME